MMQKAAPRRGVERARGADRAPEAAESRTVVQGPRLGRLNYVLLALALAVIVLGFTLLGAGSVTAAPILLVVAYLVLVPVAILKR